MDVDCRWPGSCHDAKVYANSKIYNNMQDNEMPMQFKQILPGEAKIPNYLIGDPAYPLMTSSKINNGVINQLLLSRELTGESFKLIPPLDPKIWHGPCFSL